MSTYTSQDIARAEALRAGFVARRIAEQYGALDAGDSPESMYGAGGGWDDLTAEGRAFHLGQARDVIEAAVVDGANRWRTFLHVTVPLLRPTLIFVVITSTIGGLQIFDEPRLFDTFGLGGPDREWMTVTMYLYELGWAGQRNLGRAAAVAWLLFLIIVLFALLNYAITRRIASTEARPKRKGR